MADFGRASQWVGYNTLAGLVDYSSDYLDRPQSPRLPPAPAHTVEQQWWNSPSPDTASSPSSIGSPGSPAMSPSQFSSFAMDSYPGSPTLSPSYADPNSSFLSCASNSFRAASPVPAHVITQSQYPNIVPTHHLAVRPFSFKPGPVIPQRKYAAPLSTACPRMVIPFRLEHQADDGVPMHKLRDISALDLPMIGRDHTPFDETIATTITLRIWWPGYKQWSRRMTMRKATGLITRCELAMAITEVYSDFFHTAVVDVEDRDPSVPHWSFGPEGIRLEHLSLLRVEQVSQGSWQADIRIIYERS